MKKIFIDTDVILDTLLDRKPHVISSAKLLNLVSTRAIIGFTSTLALANIYYVHRKVSENDITISYLKFLMNLMNILSVDKKNIEMALNCKNFKDFEDAIQHFCARENDMEFIITRNVSDYRYSNIPVLTPMQFLNSYHCEGV